MPAQSTAEMQRCRVRDFYPLPASREILPGTGFLRAPAKIARTGIQTYSCRELGLDGGDKPMRLWRPPEEVAKSVKTFESAPMTNEHPPNGVDAVNWKLLAVGDVRDCAMAGDFIEACVIVRDEDMIRTVQDGKAEISCGYEFGLDMTSGTTPAGEQYDAVQRDIVGNHVAIVDRGRAGSRVRIADSTKGQPMLIRLKAADTVISPKVTVVGFDQEIEIADAAIARRVQDAFDLHKHGIEAAKDEHKRLQDAYDSLAKKFEEFKSGMGADDDDEIEEAMEEDDAAFEGKETPEEEAAEARETKKTADGRKVGYTKDGRPGIARRLRRAHAEIVRLKDEASPEKIEARAAERAEVLDAARPIVGDKFSDKGKSVHEIRVAAITAAAKDEGLKKVVDAALDGAAPAKLSTKDTARVFKTVVAIADRASGTTTAADDGGDSAISHALLAAAQDGGDGQARGVSARDMFLRRNADDSRMTGRPSSEN